MKKEITIREWINNFNNGKYDINSRKIQIEAGWFDWFCSTDSLKNKTRKIGNIIKDITNDYILDNYHIWFKNNCPFVGRLYDDIRFEPINEAERDKKYFVVSIDDDRKLNKYAIFTMRSNKVEFTADTKKVLLKIINYYGDLMSKED